MEIIKLSDMETLCDPQNDDTIFYLITGKIIQIEMTTVY